MTVQDVMELTGAKLLNPGADTSRPVRFGYACDLLSWVMTRAAKETVWITVMTHMNVVAVATLLDIACVLIPEDIQVEENTLAKAAEEEIPVLSSGKTAFELAGLLYGAGVTRPVKD